MATSSWTGPTIIGEAAAGLSGDTSWAANDAVAEKGADGERRTAEMLRRWLADGSLPGAVVLHDLKIPARGITANVDHAIVTGRRLLLVDSKMWKPGRYFTFRGRTFRSAGGWPKRFPHADKSTMELAVSVFEGLYRNADIEVDVARPVLAVWPSQSGKLHLRRLRVPGAHVMEGDDLLAHSQTLLSGPASAEIVNWIVDLVAKPGSVTAQATVSPNVEVVDRAGFSPASEVEAGLPDASDFERSDI